VGKNGGFSVVVFGSDSSSRYSSPSGLQSIPTTVVNPGNDALANRATSPQT
jgi:hypothetical protein